jgi:hypothetical protein
MTLEEVDIVGFLGDDHEFDFLDWYSDVHPCLEE